jgi:hypothetical protein
VHIDVYDSFSVTDFVAHSCSHHSRPLPLPALAITVVDLGAVLVLLDLVAAVEVMTHTQLPPVEVEPHRVATVPPPHNMGHQHKRL